MPSKSKPQTETSTTAAQPWVEEQLKFGNSEARRLYDQGAPAYYPNQTYVNFDPASTQALNLTEQRALAGNAGTRAAQGMVTDTLNGNFLNANPYLDNVIAANNRDTTRDFFSAVNQVRGSAAGAGRYGSGAAMEAEGRTTENFGRTLADNATRLRSAQYDAERGRQFTAAGMAPQLAAQDYVDLAQLGNVGAAREGKAGEALQSDIDRYNYNANAQGQNLDQLLARLGQISPLAGTVGTQTKMVPKSNTFGQLAGLGLQAAGMYFGGPMGASVAGRFAESTGYGSSGAPMTTGSSISTANDAMMRRALGW
jgi:hypothetical protein